MHISLEETRDPSILDLVKAGMRRHTQSCVEWEEYRELTVVARNERGEVVGAAFAETGRTWLHLLVVWVDEQQRRRGLGRNLVEAAEAEARSRGCHNAYLDTFSYQAQPFYEKLGYVVFGALDDYPPGHQRGYMRKSLG